MSEYKVTIIGGGPGGYETAIRLNQYGIECLLIEEERVGGVCLNRGCIPTKALVKSAELYYEMSSASNYGLTSYKPELDYKQVFNRKNAIVEQLVNGIELIFRKRNIPILKDRAIAISLKNDKYLIHTAKGEQIETEYIVIATGSLPKSLPNITIDEVNILSSTGMLNLSTLPESLAIVGGGVIGCEFASIMNSFGVQTSIIEFLPRILPSEDEEISKRITVALKKVGIKIYTSTAVENIKEIEQRQKLSLSNGSTLTVDKVLLSVGRIPNCNLDWNQMELETEHNAIVIDEFMRTNLNHIYAIGDVTGKLALAHTASKQGEIAAAHIASNILNIPYHHPPLNYTYIPRCTFTSPEVASVGYTEEEARKKFGELKIGKFPYSANGKAMAMSSTYGMVKTIARADNSELVGMHIIGANATELIAQGAILISLGAKSEVIDYLTFAHPTLSETIKESLEDLNNLSIHKI
ncbi:MAG TPA: dihydrolipoyl dehydrogenase [Candidatus Syntrophosphaera thermopropionivorans]|nr:dihydrolipoyl dehydrogenase [Candidatus Syntrophosphaera thermopropionivorans]